MQNLPPFFASDASMFFLPRPVALSLPRPEKAFSFPRARSGVMFSACLAGLVHDGERGAAGRDGGRDGDRDGAGRVVIRRAWVGQKQAVAT